MHLRTSSGLSCTLFLRYASLILEQEINAVHDDGFHNAQSPRVPLSHLINADISVSAQKEVKKTIKFQKSWGQYEIVLRIVVVPKNRCRKLRTANAFKTFTQLRAWLTIGNYRPGSSLDVRPYLTNYKAAVLPPWSIHMLTPEHNASLCRYSVDSTVRTVIVEHLKT